MKIIKIGAVICVDRAVLAVRKAGDARNTYMLPGGKPHPGEEPLVTLARELREELSAGVLRASPFGWHQARSALEPQPIEMTMYDVVLDAPPVASSEIEELRWLVRGGVEGLRLGSVLADYVLPKLIEQGRF